MAPLDADEAIANGHVIDQEATALTLDDTVRSKYAIVPNGDTFPTVHLDRTSPPQGICPGRQSTLPNQQPLLSPWAVFSTGPLLTVEECQAWIQKANDLELETGDFIFKTGAKGYERMKTGGRRFSSTTIVQDTVFAQKAAAILRRPDSLVPLVLGNGKVFRGVRSRFLVSKYTPGQFFAPHFDGQIVEDDPNESLLGSQSEFTAVLYLSDDFEGGATLYLPTATGDRDKNDNDNSKKEKNGDHWSEVQEPVAVRPAAGCAVTHRACTVMHGGGEVLQGVKYILQFGLMYSYYAEPATTTTAASNSMKDDKAPASFRWAV
jgi:hypothetical protein